MIARMVFVAALAGPAVADDPPARVVPFHGYTRAVEMTSGPARVVLGPEVGGRVLEFTVGGRTAVMIDDAEKAWRPGQPPQSSAGRFDYGPELTVTPHPKTWGGEWATDIRGDVVALTGPDDPAGIKVAREFRFIRHGPAVGLAVTQTLTNTSPATKEVCHWGRSFSPGGGVCVVPVGDRPTRFPGGYAMYESGSVINVKNADDKIRLRDGFVEILAPPRKPKLGFDSYAGWLAYAMPGDTLFVKRFKTYPDRVYNEAAGLTISVWYPQAGNRIELEPIGTRERLEPGQSAAFTEEWWVLSHPFPKPGESLDLKALAARVAAETAEPK